MMILFSLLFPITLSGTFTALIIWGSEKWMKLLSEKSSSILSNTYLWTSKSIWRFMYKVLHCRVCITGMASSLSSLSLHENKHWGQILYKVVFAFLQIVYRVVRQWWIIRKPLETSENRPWRFPAGFRIFYIL